MCQWTDIRPLWAGLAGPGSPLRRGRTGASARSTPAADAGVGGGFLPRARLERRPVPAAAEPAAHPSVYTGRRGFGRGVLDGSAVPAAITAAVPAAVSSLFLRNGSGRS